MATIDAHGRYIYALPWFAVYPHQQCVRAGLPTYGIDLYAMRGLSALSVSTIRQCESLEGGMGSGESHAFLFIDFIKKTIRYWGSIGTRIAKTQYGKNS